jgi:RHS repeat-associated protein
VNNGTCRRRTRIRVALALLLSLTPGLARAAADLEITLTITPQSASVGDTITYVLVIRNLGPDATQSSQFTVTTQLRPQIFQPLTIESTRGECSLGANGENYRCVYPRFLAGDEVRVTIVGRAIAAGSELFAAGFIPADDPNGTNNLPRVTLTVVDPAFCADCLVGTVTCGAPVTRRLDRDCPLGFRFSDLWRLEVERAGRVRIDLKTEPVSSPDLTVRDASCHPVPRSACSFRVDGVACTFDVQPGTHFVVVALATEGDYILDVDCGGLRSLACSPDAEGNIALSWARSPLTDATVPIAIFANGMQVASAPGGAEGALVSAAALGDLPDGIAEVCAVDSSGRPACCGVFLGDDLAVNCGGERLDGALGTGIGDGRIWTEDSLSRPSPFLSSRDSAVIDFAGEPGGFLAADTRLVEPQFTDDRLRSRLFTTARTDADELTYRFAVRPGTYEVTLLFADCCSSGGCLAIPDPSESPGPCRVFDVALNGEHLERLAPHLEAQLALGNALPSTRHGVALARGPFRLAKVGEIELTLRDLGPGNPPLDPIIQGILLRRVRAARFALDLEGTACGETHEGPAGSVFRSLLECTLETSENPHAAGARAWALSLGIEGATIAAITTAGTVAAPAPAGLRRNGFELSEITAGPGNDGAVSTVVLSFDLPTSLPPEGTEVVARIEVEGEFPSAGCSREVTVFFADGRTGSSGPVLNRIEQLDLAASPLLGVCSFELRGLDVTAFLRGDANTDGRVDISDAVTVLLHLFRGRLLSCLDAADADDSGVLVLTDAIFLLDYLFRAGPPLPPPFTGCGADPTADALDCGRYEPCAPPPPPPGGDLCPPPSAGPLLVRSAPPPFELPLIKGLPGRSRLTVRNPASRSLVVESIALEPRFDHTLFSLAPPPRLPVTVRPGEAVTVELAGASSRLGFHRLDVRFRTFLGDHVEEVLFEVARGALPVIPRELVITTLPGQAVESVLRIGNDSDAAEELMVVLDGPARSGPFSIDPRRLPLRLPPGGETELPVLLRFGSASPGAFGERVEGELRLRSNGGQDGDGPTGRLHTVRLRAEILPAASLSGPPAIALGEEAVRTLLVEKPFRGASFTVRSLDPRVLRLRDRAGLLADELRGVQHGEALTFAGVGPGIADVRITLQEGGGGGGVRPAASALGLALLRMAIAAPAQAARPLTTEARDRDFLDFLELPAGRLLAAHEFSGRSILRGSDVVAVELDGARFGLFQDAAGATHIYRFADGARTATVASRGGSGVPGVEPAAAILTVGGERRAIGVSVDSLGNLVAYDVPSGAVLGTASLAASSTEGQTGIGEDVDLLIHGEDGSTTAPPAVFVMALSGECFVASLPDLAQVTRLGKLEGGARVAVDPVAMGPDLVVFQDARGELLFADRRAGGFRSYRRPPRIEPSAEGTLLIDSPFAEVDIVTTPDGRYGVQLAADGHAYLLDREKLDPQGALAGQTLHVFRAPFNGRSLVGVDPLIARYDPASPTREADARVAIAYERDVVRLFSFDGSRQFTYEPLGESSGWERNIDLLVGPKGASGLEDHLIIRHGGGVIRVVDLASGRVLHTITDPDRSRPFEGVDPRLTPDGRLLIDVSRSRQDGNSQLVIHGVHPSNFGLRTPVEASFGPAELDVDLVLHESGAWAAFLDRAGHITVFDLQGRVLRFVPAPAGRRTIEGADLTLAREPAGTPDPDEDWVVREGPGEPNPPVRPPPQTPPPPPPRTPGHPVPPQADPEPDNPDDDTEEGAGVCVLPDVCLCAGDSFHINRLRDAIPELQSCPPGSSFVTDIKVVSQTAVSECTTVARRAIVFRDHIIPLDELIVGGPDACNEDHYHAANGSFAVDTLGRTVPDPNPFECGYGRVSEVEVVEIDIREDCSGKVVSVDSPRISATGLGTAVLHIRPCVPRGASPEQIALKKPYELTVVVVGPRRLTADLQARPFTRKSVDKQSKEHQCIAAACGDIVRLTAESCPSRCVHLLQLGDPRATGTGLCSQITDPLTPIDEGTAFLDFRVPGNCGVRQAILKCDNLSSTALQPIDIHVMGPREIRGPEVVTFADVGLFLVEFCQLIPNCENNPALPRDCDLLDLQVQTVQLLDRTELKLFNPDGNQVPFDPTLFLTFGPSGDQPAIIVPVQGDGPAGDWKLRVELGTCMRERTYRVTPRSRTGTGGGSEQHSPRNRRKGGDPVHVHSGEYVCQKIDLMVPGRGIHFLWDRIYKSQVDYRGPLGNNWDFTYNERLEFEDLDGDGDIDVRHVYLLFKTEYPRTGNGPLDYQVPDGQYKRLRRNPDGSFSLRFRNGRVHTFHGPGAAPRDGLLREITDRTGANRLRFEHDDDRQLRTIIDTYGRRYEIEYIEGKIHKLRDFGGREVVYEYYGPGEAGGSDGDLKSVRGPLVAGTPNGNDFPEGKKTVYTYLTGPVHPRLRGNLVSVTLPNEVARGGPPSLVNTYGTDPDDPLTFDRVITQFEGGANHSGIRAGGAYQYYYEDLNRGADPQDLELPRRRTIMVDRMGNVREYLFNGRFELIEQRMYTGRVSPTLRLPHAIEARGPGLRSAFPGGEGRPGPDPDFYASRYRVNRHGEVTRLVLAEGNVVETLFGFEDSPDPLARGNVTELRWTADAARAAPQPGGSATRRKTFTYEPLTNGVASLVEFRGNDPDHDGPDADGEPDGPDRYRTSFFFDYQELSDAALVRAEAAAWGIEIPPGFPLGLGDLNGDGLEGPMHGLPVLEVPPAATVLEWDGERLGFGAPQEASASMRYNQFGQLVSESDYEENVTEYLRYPSTDPDGDGLDLIAGNDPETGGYLRTLLRDSASAPGRNSGRDAPPENRAVHYGYNRYGYITEVIDGRGVVTQLARNALDQVTRAVRAEAIDLQIRGPAPPEEALVRPLGYVEDIFYDHNDNVVRTQLENRDSGTAARNPTFDADFAYDIRNRRVRASVEVDESTRAAWEYRYDANENLVEVRKPERNATRTLYDERDLVLSITEGANDPLAAATTFFAYDRNANPRFTVDAEDNDGDGFPEATETVYDGWDRPRRVIDPAGQETLIDYDAADNVVRERIFGTSGGPTPRRGDGPALTLLRESRSHFDERSRRIRGDRLIFGPFRAGLETVEGPLTAGGGEASTVYELDRLGRLVRLVDDRGHDVRLAYNGLSEEVLRESQAVGRARNSVETFYDRGGHSFHQVEREVLPDGGAEIFEVTSLHDALGRLVRRTDSVGQTIHLAYDSRDHLTAASDAKGPLIGIDPTGATALPVNAAGNTQRFVTDGLGRRTLSFIDLRPGGAGDGLPAFDTPPNPTTAPAPRETTAANPDGIIMEQMVYDLNSRLIASTDDRGNTTRFAYDALDRLVAQVHADGSRWTFAYDRDGHLVTAADPRGVVLSYAHDGLGREVSVSVDSTASPGVAGTTLITREFDGLDRLTRLTDDNGVPGGGHEILLAYDSLDNILREVQDGSAVESRWDTLGNKLATVYPGDGRRLLARFDALERSSELVLEVAGRNPLLLAATEYAGAGYRRVREVLGNGLETRFGYDRKRRLLSVETRAGAAVVTGRAYTYDRADLRITERWLDRLAPGGHEGRTYAVDSRGRLVGARPAVLDAAEATVSQAPLEASFRWLLDGAGNWVEYGTPQGVRAAAFDVLNQDRAHVHDARGSRVADERRACIYDGLGRLVEVRDASGAFLESYTYDGVGRRATRTVASGAGLETTRFIYDRHHVIEERSGGGVVARNYYDPDGVDRLLVREGAAGLVWLHADAVNSTTAVTGALGDVVERYEYSPYGEVSFLGADLTPLERSASGNPYLFTGRRLDGTGLYHFRARYLDPASGRFLSRDAEQDPLNDGNLYSYAGLNPLVHVDPFGQSGQKSGWHFEPNAQDTIKNAKAIGRGIWKKIKQIGGAIGYVATLPHRAALMPDQTKQEVAGFFSGIANAIAYPLDTLEASRKRHASMTDEEWLEEVFGGIVVDSALAFTGTQMSHAAQWGQTAQIIQTAQRGERVSRILGGTAPRSAGAGRPSTAGSTALSEAPTRLDLPAVVVGPLEPYGAFSGVQRVALSGHGLRGAGYFTLERGNILIRTPLMDQGLLNVVGNAIEGAASHGLPGRVLPLKFFGSGTRVPNLILHPPKDLKLSFGQPGRIMLTVEKPTPLSAIVEQLGTAFPDRFVIIDWAACTTFKMAP